ncbi:hypothetical protein Dimus_027611 [Dionaea muscipula]
MYGGVHKFGRGGGGGGRGGAAAGGGGKRNMFPVPHRRPSGGTPGGGARLSAPIGRNPSAPARSSSATAATTAQVAAEETFRLVPGKPDTFAAFIRLAPDLINEIKRVEEQGGAARIKFDTNRNNPAVNVIDVGGKEFRFTWSHETGDLCDIYEERESGEVGNGLLVESGCPWRKLNVQRILDESAKNHVKMRSEEAERKLKSRKAIVLDPSNPSMKSQAKALAAVEVSPWKTFKQKKEPPLKKRKVEPPQVSVGGLPKTVHKSGFPATNVKGKLSTSPAPSPPNQSVFVTSASASAKSNMNKGQAVEADAVNVPLPKAGTSTVSQSEGPSRDFGPSEGTACRKDNQGATPADLQEMLINLLKENPTGISVKDMEKAVGDTVPNSARKVQAILKKIATLHAPGKYLLNPGIELESTKRISTGSERSPEDNQHKLLVLEENHGAGSAQVNLNIVEKSPEDLRVQPPLESSRIGERVSFMKELDVSQHTSELFGDRKGSDNSEGRVGSSSDTGSDSDSDSDSSDSGSDSGSQSRSRSRSPVGSGSGSSSDSESESSANSKEGSDVDVDIMTSDDEKETKHNEVVKPDSHGFQAVEIDDHRSEDVEIEKDLPDNDQEADQATRMVSAPYSGAVSSQDFHYTSPIKGKYLEHLKPPDFSGRDSMVTDDFRHEQPDRSEKSKGKSKRNADMKRLEEIPGPAKRSKVGFPAQSSIGHQAPPFSKGMPKVSPGELNRDHAKGHNIQTPNRYNRDDHLDAKGFNHGLVKKSMLEPEQSGGRASSLLNDPEIPRRSGQNTGTWGQGLNSEEQIAHTHEGLSNEKSRVPRGINDAQGISVEKMNRKFKDSGNKQSVHQESQYRKRDDNGQRRNMEEHFSNSHVGSSPKRSVRAGGESSPMVNGKGHLLRRELSDLELGELREPLSEELAGDMQQFGEKDSFKQLETNRGTSDSCNEHFSNGRPVMTNPALDAGKPSCPNTRAGVSRNYDGLSKRRSPDPCAEDSVRPSNKAVQSASHPSNSTVESRSLSNKATERQRGIESQPADMEGFGETHKKLHDRTKLTDSEHEYASNYANGTKAQHYNSSADASDRKIGDSLNDGHKRSESSPDDSNSYLKYEKKEPELKGPIKDFLQYKEFVKEFSEKYESYSSLTKILEADRNEFEKLGRDLGIAKGRDMERYHKILSKLNERFHQRGPKHKRLKKIFAVLHQELEHLKQRIVDFAAAYTKD